MKETKNNIPDYIEKAFQEFISEMEKFRILIFTAREYILSSQTNSNKEDGIPYLQISIASLLLRQAIELLIFSNLLIDKRKYEIIQKCKNWRIQKVIKGIEEVNKNWFPKALKIIEEEWTIEEINNLKIDINSQPKKDIWVDKETINKEDICNFYDYLSDFIHYENHFKKSKEWGNKNFIQNTLSTLSNICWSLIHLTNTFTIEISSTDFMFYVNINNDIINGNIFQKKQNCSIFYNVVIL